MAVTYGWTLNDIIGEVRAITGRPNESMMSNDQIITYINRYYQNVLTKELKLFFGYTYHSIYTQANINFYLAPQDFQTLNPVATVDGFPMTWYIDPDLFYQDYPSNNFQKQSVGTGDGSTNAFSFTVQAPVRQGSLYVSDGTQIAKSSARGNFYNPAITDESSPLVAPRPSSITGGNINFVTGTVTNMAFSTPPALGADLQATWLNYLPNRPQAILFYQNYPLSNSTYTTYSQEWWFNVAPVPDQTYRIRLKGIQVPAALINLTDIPFRQDLGPLIALGTSQIIFRNFNQMDQYQQIQVEFDRYKHICMTDTYEEYLYQRSVSKF